MKKFELTAEFVTNVFGKKLFRIKALVAFGDVEKGELGGFIEKEDNLSHDDNAWVSGNAWVYGDARVYGDAWVSGNARVSGNAWVYGNAQVSGNADYAAVAGFGRYSRTTTFFRCKDKILRVQCGCFYGDLAQFREIVKKTHGDSKYAKEYLAIADLMELHFSDECGGEQMNDGKIH
jgi:hypothetical protein